jgi:hypothetical protein
MGAVVQRGAHGHFLPGQSGNAGGRPASLARVRELLAPHTEKFVEELVKLLESDDEAIRLAACREFFDRYVGKPVQAVESDVRTLNLGQLYVEALRLSNSGRATATVDAVTADAIGATVTRTAVEDSTPSRREDDAW